MEYLPPLKYRVRQSVHRFVVLYLISAGLLLLARLFEVLVVSFQASYPAGSYLNLATGIFFDLVLASRLALVLLIPFTLIDLYSQKVARVFHATVTCLVVVGYVALLQYFAATRIPLESDILGYSLSEISHTVGASGEVNLLTILPLVFFLALSVFAYIKWHSAELSSTVETGLAILFVVCIMPFIPYNPDPSEYRDVFRMNIAANKFNLFSSSLIDYYFPARTTGTFVLNDQTPAQPTAEKEASPVPEQAVPSAIMEKPAPAEKGKGAAPVNSKSTNKTAEAKPDNPGPSASEYAGNPFSYINQDYPFLHEEHTPDLLSPFFNNDATAPSIVFIVVESLGSAYSGKEAYLGSFTPFLDSLMSKSLYWSNCLSTSGRTFSVLPSMLGSLPFGEKGFANLDDRMPDHLSLISLLKNKAGYTSSFYYGGDPKFDEMEQFLRYQGTGKIVGEKNFGAGYQRLPANSGGFSWGYGDREIFRKYLDDLKTNERDRRVDVILTLAMHSPFLVNDQEKYNSMFQERLNSIKLTEEKKTYNSQYRANFATILYFDDALRYFFKEFSKLKSFENTIFVITGDHRMPEIPISTQIDRFHVPLVIYSPMLKKSQDFSPIVTHFDVTPSLLAFLKNRLELSLPTVTTWIGHGLDTGTSFRNLNAYPLKRNTGELIDFISRDYFLSGSTLYKVYPDLDIEPITDDALKNRIRSQFDDFKARNNFAIQGNHLIPDSLKIYTRP